jgi:hypothetical protein
MNWEGYWRKKSYIVLASAWRDQYKPQKLRTAGLKVADISTRDLPAVTL